MSRADLSAAAVEATILDILSDALDEPVDDLRSNRVLAAHEWDSITSLLSLAQLESQFGVTLDLRSYHAARTVDDLVNLVVDNTINNTVDNSPQGAPR
jgi:acyl carrier protein